MNDAKQTTPCTCTTCPGASCPCGCQKPGPQAASQATCACGPQCACGTGCTCPRS